MQAVSGAPSPQRIGEILISRGMLTAEDLDRALEVDAEADVAARAVALLAQRGFRLRKGTAGAGYLLVGLAQLPRCLPALALDLPSLLRHALQFGTQFLQLALGLRAIRSVRNREKFHGVQQIHDV